LLSELKREFLKLLGEDLEFRYAVVGFIGLDEILKRLEKHDEKFNELLGRLDRHEQLFIEIFKRLDRHEEIFTDILRRLDRNEAELVKLREDMIEGFRRHDDILAMHTQEIAKLREDMTAGFRRHDEEIVKLRGDMVEGFKRHDEELTKLRQDMVEGFKRHDEILMIHAQEIARLREDMMEGFRRYDEELVRIRSDMIEGFKRHDEEIAKLREDMIEGFRRHDTELARLRQDMAEGFKRHDEILATHAREIAELRHDFRDMLSVVKRMEVRLSRVERTLEKVTLDIEEEAREVLRSRLREMGYEVDLDILRLPMVEIDIYGVSRDLCVIGEATIRLGVRSLDRFIGKVEMLEKLYPDKLKPKKVILVYTCLATDEAVRKAMEKGIWVLKALGDITPFTILES
jgi:chromosome segregation ATPase